MFVATRRSIQQNYIESFFVLCLCVCVRSFLFCAVCCLLVMWAWSFCLPVVWRRPWENRSRMLTTKLLYTVVCTLECMSVSLNDSHSNDDLLFSPCGPFVTPPPPSLPPSPKQYLLSRSADPDAVNSVGETPGEVCGATTEVTDLLDEARRLKKGTWISYHSYRCCLYRVLLQ